MKKKGQLEEGVLNDFSYCDAKMISLQGSVAYVNVKNGAHHFHMTLRDIIFLTLHTVDLLNEHPNPTNVWDVDEESQHGGNYTVEFLDVLRSYYGSVKEQSRRKFLSREVQEFLMLADEHKYIARLSNMADFLKEDLEEKSKEKVHLTPSRKRWLC